MKLKLIILIVLLASFHVYAIRVAKNAQAQVVELEEDNRILKKDLHNLKHEYFKHIINEHEVPCYDDAQKEYEAQYAK